MKEKQNLKALFALFLLIATSSIIVFTASLIISVLRFDCNTTDRPVIFKTPPPSIAIPFTSNNASTGAVQQGTLMFYRSAVAMGSETLMIVIANKGTQPLAADANGVSFVLPQNAGPAYRNYAPVVVFDRDVIPSGQSARAVVHAYSPAGLIWTIPNSTDTIAVPLYKPPFSDAVRSRPLFCGD